MAAPTTTAAHLGVTPPISTAGPSKKEDEVTVTLMQELRDQNRFESDEEAKTREIVLGRIAGLVRKFVHKISIVRGMSEAAANAAGGKIFTYGSYRLGVHGPGSDIDTLVVVPKHVNREDFFSEFEPMLREMDGVSEVSGIPEAYVPIIKTKVQGIPIDMVLARVALAVVNDDLDLRDDNILKNLDERCVRSLGGSRMTDQILNLVPNQSVFRDSLRCIKFWAQQRAIYSNVNGFLGGVAWAMLVARICQLYPNANAGVIVSRFFIIMREWKWPNPVLLKPIEDGPLQVRVWNPKLYPSDRAHRMPIITPNYPSMCATHNVTQSTQMLMKHELHRASEIVDSIIIGSSTWTELFAKHDFFQKYRYYLMVIASTENAELQLKWSGTVESRIRQLVMKLELVDSLVLAHPFVKGFDQTHYCIDEDEVRAAAQGLISEAMAKRTQQDIENQQSAQTVYTTTFYIGLGIEPKQPGAVGPRKLDISYPTADFTKMVKQWDQFDEARMGVVVRHIRSTSLPEYVFDGSERRGNKLKRTKSSKSGGKNTSPDLPNKKRRSSLSTSDTPGLQTVSPSPAVDLGARSRSPSLRSPIAPMLVEGTPISTS
ncbi:polymerase [Auriculariales sp. MPI-PUGE-AT-0066]|nr:polymerase [Auriculariales sp. MPI-PUGE-AT-0066]